MHIKYIPIFLLLASGCAQKETEPYRVKTTSFSDYQKEMDDYQAKYEAKQKEFESKKPFRVAAWEKKYPTNKKAIEAAKNIVKEQLKDPESVQFQEIVVGEHKKVTGHYNAKNSYGGYVGYKLFIIESEEDVMVF